MAVLSERISARGLANGWSARRWVGVIALAICLLYLPIFLDTREVLGLSIPYFGITVTHLNLALTGMLGAIALNLLTGSTGLVSLGSAAFLAIGAMAAGVFGTQLGFPFPIALLAAIAAGALLGLVVGLPALRVRGIYLILVTLGLHFIVMFAFLKYQIGVFGTGGVSFKVATIGPIALNNDVRWAWFLLVLSILTIWGTRNLLRTREGRALVAVRDNELAATAAGIDLVALKLKAFCFTSAMMSGTGAISAYYLSNVSWESYTLEQAIGYIAMIILGGLGSLQGSVLGAIAWQLLPQLVSLVTVQVAALIGGSAGLALTRNRGPLTDIAFGAVIVLVLLMWPKGLVGVWESVKAALARRGRRAADGPQ